jgi:two-component sensor histidine kinase
MLMFFRIKFAEARRSVPQHIDPFLKMAGKTSQRGHQRQKQTPEVQVLGRVMQELVANSFAYGCRPRMLLCHRVRGMAATSP